MKKKEYNKLIVICIILLFVISAWMFGGKNQSGKGEQADHDRLPISEYQLLNEYSDSFKCRLYSDYMVVWNNHGTPTGIKYIGAHSIEYYLDGNKIIDRDTDCILKWDGSRTYIELTLPKRNSSIFFDAIGFACYSVRQDIYNLHPPIFDDVCVMGAGDYPTGFLIGDSSGTAPFEITPSMMHEIRQATISNFQQTQVDLTHEKVTFNTDINTKAKYYLKIGGTWHLQSTESNYSTNHSYTFVVDAYTSTDYKIELYDAFDRKMNADKTGTIRTVGPEICGDGIDNDNDGLTDWDDTECVRVTITKKSENVGTTTYYGVFTITGDAEAYIEYQKGSGQVKKVNLTKVGQDYVLSLENLEPDSAYNGIIYAQDVNFPENNANIPLTFTTLKEGGIIEVTSEETTSDTFNCKFRINADTINSLTFSYKTPYGSINEVDPNDQGNNTYAVSITGLSAGDYEYIIETSTNKGDDSHEGTFTIEEIPPETSPPPTNTNTPTLSVPPSPSNSDYSMTVLIIVVILLVGALIYTNYYKKTKRRR